MTLNVSASQLYTTAANATHHAASLSSPPLETWSAAEPTVMPLYGGGFFIALLQVAAVYYITAISLHYLVPLLLQPATIQVAERRKGQVTMEFTNSLGPIAVKAAVFTAVERLHSAGYGRMYVEMPSTLSEVAYMVGTLVALDYLHDTWFYWTHRALHWRPLYANIHYIHHQSTSPTAFTGYSFHVIEAAIVFANEIFVIFLFPLHAGLHRLYHLFTTVIHNGGHAGYEIAPLIPSIEQVLWTAGHLLLGRKPGPASDLNMVKDHDLHHRFPRSHFSLYFRHWDSWCGTARGAKQI